MKLYVKPSDIIVSYLRGNLGICGAGARLTNTSIASRTLDLSRGVEVRISVKLLFHNLARRDNGPSVLILNLAVLLNLVRGPDLALELDSILVVDRVRSQVLQTVEHLIAPMNDNLEFVGGLNTALGRECGGLQDERSQDGETNWILPAPTYREGALAIDVVVSRGLTIEDVPVDEATDLLSVRAQALLDEAVLIRDLEELRVPSHR